jgi:hypothetical protein
MSYPKRAVHFRSFWIYAFLALFVAAGLPVRAENLVELELVSRKRPFTPKKPVESISQDFRITGPGILTVEWVTDPHQGANGGYGIKAKDGSPLYLGRESIREETPKPLKVGVKYSLKQVIIVPKATKPLEAVLTAWWAPQAMQILNYGDQLPAKQRLTVGFVPLGQATKKSGAPAAVNISGTWRYDSGAGANLTFTPKGEGIYEVVEKGYGNGRGTARVSGRTVTIEYTNPTPYGTQKSGVYVLEVGAGDKNMSGGWLTNNGENGSTSLTRTTPLPAAQPVAQQQPQPQPQQQPQPTPQPTVTGAKPGGSGYGAQADSFRGRNGERFTFVCPPNGNPSGRLWGTDLYTDDSSVCTAAVHAGLITLKKGGTVTIEIRPGAASYKGSLRNGIESKDWGSHAGSFVFVVTETKPPQKK